MSNTGIFICQCSGRSRSSEAGKLARLLEGEGGRVDLIPMLCTPKGIGSVRERILEDDPDRIVVGACDLMKGGIRWLARDLECRWTLFDIQGEKDPEAIVPAMLRAVRDFEVPVTQSGSARSVLIVGGGVSGVQAALDVAEAGYPVTIVEASPTIGGTMARLDKTFPTLDCSICILGPKLADVGSHPGIEVMTHSRVIGASGRARDFRVTVETQPRYIDTEKCNGCGRCAEVCPVVVPNEWDVNLKARKAIYISFAQSVPLRSTIDMDHCIRCEMCVRVCEREAINFEDQSRVQRLDVGAVVLTSGIELFDATRMVRYGYGRLENVLNNLDFERVVCASGPTEGRLIRPDGKKIERLAFIQCVGSRDVHFHAYCSAYCCMASIKQAMLVKEHDAASDISVFYNDIRASGKGFQEFYNRARRAGIRFIKSLPGEIRQSNDRGDLKIQYEEPESFQLKTMDVDMVILAAAIEPAGECQSLARLFGLERDPWGFLEDSHPARAPFETAREGIYVAGACVGPKDIPESVAQGSAVAAKICRLFYTLESE